MIFLFCRLDIPSSQIIVRALKKRGVERENEREVGWLNCYEKGPPSRMELKVREIRKKKHLLYLCFTVRTVVSDFVVRCLIGFC